MLAKLSSILALVSVEWSFFIDRVLPELNPGIVDKFSFDFACPN